MMCFRIRRRFRLVNRQQPHWMRPMGLPLMKAVTNQAIFLIPVYYQGKCSQTIKKVLILYH